MPQAFTLIETEINKRNLQGKMIYCRPLESVEGFLCACVFVCLRLRQQAAHLEHFVFTVFALLHACACTHAHTQSLTGPVDGAGGVTCVYTVSSVLLSVTHFRADGKHTMPGCMLPSRSLLGPLRGLVFPNKDF